MSETFQAVTRGPSFTGRGKRPVFTPDHQVDFEMGSGPLGAKIEESRTNPVSGRPMLFFDNVDSIALMESETIHREHALSSRTESHLFRILCDFLFPAL